MEIGRTKIVEENKRFLKIAAVISKVGVYKYPEGMALKSAGELRKAVRSARYAKITLGDHPAGKIIMSQDQIFGGLEKPFFDGNKMRSVLSFDKQVVPEATLKILRSGDSKDLSIGFYYIADWSPGWHRDVNTDKPIKYDFRMTNIMIDHVVAAMNPNLHGRCTFPSCGIGVDTIMKRFSVAEDKVEKRGAQWCVIHCSGPDTGKPIKCFPTEAEAQAMHRAIQARKNAGQADLFVALNSFKIELDSLTPESRMLLFGDTEQPSKEWMGGCKSKASSFADNPSAFCGWVFYHGTPELKRSFGSSSVSQGEEKKLSQEESAYAKCVREKVEGGMTDEEAREACREHKTDQDESAYEKCLIEKKAEGMSKEDAESACEALKPAAADQDEPKEKTPWQLCLQQEMASGKTKEQARMACKEKGLKGPTTQEQDQDPVAQPVESVEVLPTPLETCIATRMEAHGEDEATAKKWCEDDAAGLHQPVSTIVDNIERLKAKKQALTR